MVLCQLALWSFISYPYSYGHSHHKQDIPALIAKALMEAFCMAKQMLEGLPTFALIFSFAAAATFFTPSASTLSEVMLSRYLNAHA